jgi:hypothetical protein
MKKLSKEDLPIIKWAAVDSHGRAYGYSKKPTLGKRGWFSVKNEFPYENYPCVFIGSGFDASDWQNSLIKIDDETN